MKNKKVFVLSLILLLALMTLSGCGISNIGLSDKKYTIVCTNFPEYDWVRQILGDKSSDYELIMLLDSGVDMHSFQPTANDIVKISTCNLFVYVGGESDSWVDDALAGATNKNMKVINLLEILGQDAKEEEHIEGMQGEDHDHEADTEHEEAEYDEHVWLSLKNAEIFVNALTEALCEIDKDNASAYKENSSAYIDNLKELDNRYQATVDEGKYNTLIFGDRFPFRYMFDDYGIDYYAAFAGCSAETEASFETITFLAGKVDELSLDNVIVIESSDKKIAQTIIDNTAAGNQEILVLDSMQSVTKNDIAEGTTYISIMNDNLEILRQALQ
ncbi:MAG: metal ABC transporter substrate-binding protein [Wujia sp.]